jgi:hypothetical protein
MGLFRTIAVLTVTTSAAFGASAADLPDAIAANGEAIVLQVHAVGAQVYECKADANGRLAWQFREPIASLLRDGKTVGRHFAGPTWVVEGSVVVGKAVGPLKDVTTVQRINTVGGSFDGGCEKTGDLHAEPYAADYVFLKRASQ